MIVFTNNRTKIKLKLIKLEKLDNLYPFWAVFDLKLEDYAFN